MQFLFLRDVAFANSGLLALAACTKSMLGSSHILCLSTPNKVHIGQVMMQAMHILQELIADKQLIGHLELCEIIDPVLRAQCLSDELAQRWVAEGQPPSRRHPVGLVLEALWPEVCKVLEDGVLDDLAVDCCHTVHRVAGNYGQVCHANVSATQTTMCNHMLAYSNQPTDLERAISSLTQALICQGLCLSRLNHCSATACTSLPP